MFRTHPTPAVSDVERAVEETAAQIRARWTRSPRVGIILGTGLGGFAREIATEATFRYDELPHLPRATAIGHTGQLTCGTIDGVPLVTMEGRFHLYEGYPAWQVTLLIHVMHCLGVARLVISNAAGAVNPNYRVGDVMLIADHISLMGTGPFIGEHKDSFRSSGPENSCPYDSEMIDVAARIARRHDFDCHRGVYVGLSGPCYETRAEYRFLRRIGGDAVGMSTVPEAIAASQLGLRVLATSTITNVCRPDALSPTDGRQVVDAATRAEPKFRAIVHGLIDELTSD